MDRLAYPNGVMMARTGNRSGNAMRCPGRLQLAVPTFTDTRKPSEEATGFLPATARLTDTWPKLSFEKVYLLAAGIGPWEASGFVLVPNILKLDRPFDRSPISRPSLRF